MAPEDRRNAIIAATLPLLREFGTTVTTRQIAEAAGVAEGTIFGVFPDKTSLFVSTILAVFEADTAVDELRRLRNLPDLQMRLVGATNLLLDRFTTNGPLLWLARSLPGNAANEVFTKTLDGRRLVQEALAELMEHDRERLRSSPATAARLLMSLAFAAARDEMSSGERIASAELVAVLLHGLLIEKNVHTGSHH
jgi:AcrR family transcriptional regulator